jgi:hypothetical protein
MKIPNSIVSVAILGLAIVRTSAQTSYKIVDTGQRVCYNDSVQIAPPQAAQPFYGQDAQYQGLQPSYRSNSDGTISDHNTGLTWVQARGSKVTWANALSGAAACRVGGYADWRMPTIKELYSLIDFNGYVGSTPANSTPYIDTTYFNFVYGDTTIGERIIDCQDWTATQYLGLTMNNDSTVFGVNFADGRIKGYPKYLPGGSTANRLYVRYVRGNAAYGQNDFLDNGDSTITDRATGLTWTKPDSRTGMNWKTALAWVQTKNAANYLGHSDWRLPNAKELQSILDYSRSPSSTNSAAINPVFLTSTIGANEYPFYWTNTTHIDGPRNDRYRQAVYLCFGRALGWMQFPPLFNWSLVDVHGAGAQRSDPKSGDTTLYPHGRGPQGDVIRIYNYVRLVRGGNVTSVGEHRNTETTTPEEFGLLQNYPNPFNPSTAITFRLQSPSYTTLKIYDALGQELATLVNGQLNAGTFTKEWDASGESSGTYFYRLQAGDKVATKKLILMK